MLSYCKFFIIVLFAASFCSNAAEYAAVTPDGRGAVATVQPLATQAALDVYASGGNAVDAAIAAALTLGVVDGHNSGLGGGSFILLHRKDGLVEALDAREMAPQAASRDMYVRESKVVSELSRTGALAVGVPGSVLAYEHLSKSAGKLTFSELLMSAADLAEQGFAIDAIYAKRIARHAATFQRFEGGAAVLLNTKGDPWPVGHKLQQKDLAKTYRGIAKAGADYFYRGEFAEKVSAWMTAHGGLITEKDFADYRLRVRQPVVSKFAGHDIYGFSPPSSGGVHVAQILTMLDGLGASPKSDVERYHFLAETMKLAFADRAHWMGDPDFVDVPRGLLDKKYLHKQAQQIEANVVLSVGSAGIPPKADVDIFAKHTTHISTADKDGNWVSITTTVNTDFGSKVIVPGTGVFLNNQMDDFSAQPGVANIYGLVGSEANAIAPKKRPLSSMSPTLVLKDGRPVMSLGAAGGPTIISQVVQVLNNNLRLGMGLSEAVAAPRVHHQWRPDALYLEKTVSADDRDALIKLGHSVKTLGPYGSTQAIGLDAKGDFVAVSEPRLLERNKVAPASGKPALPEKSYLDVKK